MADASPEPGAAAATPRWPRIVLKLSGEAFGGGSYGIDGPVVRQLAEEIVSARRMGVDVAVVIGGGNIWRGMHGAGAGMDRAQADYMGMLATVINALALQDTLEQLEQPTRVMTALHMEQIAEPYIRRRAIRHFEKGRIVIFAAGTGNPFFTTDTAAALRAAEMGCDALLKGTSVDGVYNADPKKDPNAVRYDSLSYDRVLADNLKVMDASAVALCRDNNIPIVVFNIREAGNLARVLTGEGVATVVRADD